jgi:hypothetical protein
MDASSQAGVGDAARAGVFLNSRTRRNATLILAFSALSITRKCLRIGEEVGFGERA